MSSQNAGSTILGEQTQSETIPERAANGAPTNATTEELDLDDLLDYQPVPPRRVTRISVRYRRLGRGRPLPYFLDEDEGE
ncbi:MAG: hypothetical protein ACHRXM_24030 [Isosphaerales bacterium]